MEVNDYKENYGNGWVKLFRSIRDHWIWQDPTKLKWWLDIMLEVNHSGKKVNIGYKIFECSRGQTIMSLQNWADRWNVSRDTVRNFLALLENDKMIIHKNLKITTQLTVCNYDTYQGNLHTEQTDSKQKANRKQTGGDTNKNDKNEKNNKNDKNTIPEYSDFETYAKELSEKHNLSFDPTKLKLKYDSWKSDEWKDGYGKPIKNWKSKLMNVIPYLFEPKKNEFAGNPNIDNLFKTRKERGL